MYSRTIQDLRPFQDEDEAKAFVDIIREVRDRDEFLVYAWCVMPNHFHLAVRTRTVPLARSLKSIKHRYSLGHNRRRIRRGPVWQTRYDAKLVQDQRYFDQLLAYIHLNPVAAGIVDDPASYLLSGHREVLGKAKHPLTAIDEALMGFGGTRKSARAAYLRALNAARQDPWIGKSARGLAWWLPSDDREIQPADDVPYVDVLGRSTGLERPTIDPSHFLAIATQWLGIGLEEVSGRRRPETLVRRRELIAVLAVERYGISVKALAELLGRHRVTVSSWVSRGAWRRSADDAFREQLDALDRHLAGV